MSESDPFHPRQTSVKDRLFLNYSWLLRLRWVAVLGQLATIGIAVILLRIQLRITPLLVVIAFGTITNVLFYVWLKQRYRNAELQSLGARGQVLLATIMAVDFLSLTALLYFTGGLENPFSVFYFVNLALCAVLLPERLGWALVTVAVVGFSGLLVESDALPNLNRALFGTAGGPMLVFVQSGKLLR